MSEHDELLERALAGEVLSAAERALLAGDAHLRERLEDLRALAAELELEGADGLERRVSLDSSQPAPGEEELRVSLLAAMRADAPASRGNRHKPIPWLIVAAVAAVAASIVTVVLLGRGGEEVGDPQSGPGGSIILNGQDLRMLEPLHHPDGSIELRWETRLPAGTRFYCGLHPAGASTDQPLLLPLRAVGENAWILTAEEVRALPDRVQLTLAFGGGSSQRSFPPQVLSLR